MYRFLFLILGFFTVDVVNAGTLTIETVGLVNSGELTIEFTDGRAVRTRISGNFRCVGRTDNDTIDFHDYLLLNPSESVTDFNLIVLDRGIFRDGNGITITTPATFRIRYVESRNQSPVIDNIPDTFIAEVIRDPSTIDPNMPRGTVEMIDAPAERYVFAFARILNEEQGNATPSTAAPRQ